MTKTVYAMLSVLMASAPVFADGCKLHKFAEFPTTMVDTQPLMTANINGVDVQFLVDSGAFYSTISAVSAEQLKLSKTPFDLSVSGVHGTADVLVAKAKTFTMPGFALHDVQFLVGGSDVGAGAVGLLGQNFLHAQDVEYDLGQGTIRLMRAEDCDKALLAYWVSAATPYSVIELSEDPPPFVQDDGSTRIKRRPLQVSPTFGRAYVNGTELRVLFDTGAGTSILSLKAAARAGIKTDSAGVVAAGMSHGIGKDVFATYIAPVASFKIGNEEIRNTRLRVGDIDLRNADMLLGADFFLSHRIYVANSQHKVYFTYNGGPVFNLTTGKRPVSATAADIATPAPAAADAAAADAADFARRGAALASRREFEQALAALTRACELAPDNPEYRYRRGMVYWEMKQPDPAMADFDRALKLKPGDEQVLISRAELSIQKGDNAAAAADLDAADASAPKEADLRYQMGYAYQNAGRLASATTQFTLWIESHADDARMPEALNSRCWLRALAGVDLPLALADCNAALRRAPKSSPLYARVADSRGLTFLRLGNYDKSIADYDASLRIDTENAWSLYGRGIDKLRKNETAAGQADIAKATAIWPEVAKEFDQRGIVP